MKLGSLYSDPGVKDAQKGGGSSGVLEPQLCILDETFLNKSCRHPQLNGGMLPFWTPFLDLEGLGPGVLHEPWSITFKESL